MLHKFRLFLTTMFAVLILVACGSETDGDEPSVDTSDGASEVQVSEESNEADELTDEESTVETTSATEEEVTEEDIPSEADAVETAQAEEAAEEAKQLQETEAEIGLDITEEIAIEKILAVTGLNPENHSFEIVTEVDYVEVTIYEKTDEAHTLLVGYYRFIPETEEVLVQDYLNGAFIPYEDAE